MMGDDFDLQEEGMFDELKLDESPPSSDSDTGPRGEMIWYIPEGSRFKPDFPDDIPEEYWPVVVTVSKSDDPTLMPPKEYVEGHWGHIGDYGGPFKSHEPGNEESDRLYNMPLPKIPRSLGRGFNPNRGSRGRSPNFRYEYSKDVACHACGKYRIFLDRCCNIDCGIYVVCPACKDITDNQGRCSNLMCINHRHKPDEPRCEMCQKFLGEDGISPCDACRREYGYES